MVAVLTWDLLVVGRLVYMARATECSLFTHLCGCWSSLRSFADDWLLENPNTIVAALVFNGSCGSTILCAGASVRPWCVGMGAILAIFLNRPCVNIRDRMCRSRSSNEIRFLTRCRTNRWTGATGSDFRIKPDPAKLLGSAVAPVNSAVGRRQ